MSGGESNAGGGVIISYPAKEVGMGHLDHKDSRVERSSGTTTTANGSGMADVTSMKTGKMSLLGPKGFEPKSSSGECTSGESDSDKNGGGPREGSYKESRQGSNKDSQSPEGSGEPVTVKNSTPATAPGTNPITAEVAMENDAAGNKGKGDRPKLPRPEGICSCPRCGSDETKFCYYNNYNIKQPRYFCKGCQRYWTAGGMLRNVPVGAGRRNKNTNKEQDKKAAKAAAQAAAIGDNNIHAMPAGSVYAHNRHVLWDPSDVTSHDSCASGNPGMHPSMQYMHPGPCPGMAPMVPAVGFRGSRPGTMLPPPIGHTGGPSRAMDGMPVPGMPMGPPGDRATSSVSSGRSNHTMGPDMSNSVNLSEHSTGGESSENRPRQRPRRHSPDAAVAGASYGVPSYHHAAAPPSFRPGSEAVLGSVPDGGKPPGVPEGHWAVRAQSMSSAGIVPTAGPDQSWGGHQAAAAAAAAAYQAAAGSHPPPYAWPAMSAWNYSYNNAAAGWAAAAAAAYQAGPGGWPSSAPSWEHASGNAGAPAPGMAMHPPMQHQAVNPPPPSQGSYPPTMMGYPGGPPAMHGWPGWPSHAVAPGSPRPTMQGQPMAVPSHQAYPSYSMGPMPAGLSQQVCSSGMLGKHVRSYE